MTADAWLSGDRQWMTPFGQLLRSLRTRALLSQEQLAQRSGLGVRTIRDLEGGRVSYPRGKSVQLLAMALGLGGEARQAFELASRMPRNVPSADRQRVAPEAAAPSLSVADDHGAQAIPGRLRGRHRARFGWTVPAQLPMDTPVFAGRNGELAELDALLERGETGPTVVVAVVSGGPGVGKTTLAVHWAHRVGDRFPDGQLYVDLQGFDQHGPLPWAQAISGLLSALGVPGERLPTDPHAQAALYRSLLHGRRVLVVLDNARDVEQVRPLLPGTRGCMVVVTSRHRLTGLIAVEGADQLIVDVLPVAEARELMARRLGRERVLAEASAVDEIIARCARLPLAMAVFTSRTATGPHVPLAAWTAKLRDMHGGLDAFGVDATSDVRTSFSLSYHALSADAARLFRLFGRGQADLAPASAAVLTSLPERRVRAALDELSHAHLAVERRPGSFGTHRLLRAYAAELTDLGDATVNEIDGQAASGLPTVPNLAQQRVRDAASKPMGRTRPRHG